MHLLLWLLGIVVIFLVTVVALVLSTRKNLPEILAAQTEFFTETGYRHPEIPNAGIDETVRFAPRRGNAWKMELEKRYVRPDPAGAFVFASSARTEGRYRVRRESWRMVLASAPSLRLQIAERKLMPSAGKAIGEHFTGKERTWKRVYPGPIELDDKALSARFAVFGTDPDAIRRLLAKPEVRDRLLAAAEIDLVVDDASILLSDPNGNNLKGGDAGPRASLNPAPRLRASIPVHRNMHAMLGAIRDGVR